MALCKVCHSFAGSDLFVRSVNGNEKQGDIQLQAAEN